MKHSKHESRNSKPSYPPNVLAAIKSHPETLKLNLGCGEGGQQRGSSWLNLDVRDLPGVDIVHDIEVYPWPLPDSCVQVAVAGCVIEHINPAKFGVIHFMNEVWRVVRTGGQLMLSTPYAGCPAFWADPTHTCGFIEQSWLYFDPVHESGLFRVYKPRPWKIIACSFQVAGLMEVAFEKRLEDPSYYA